MTFQYLIVCTLNTPGVSQNVHNDNLPSLRCSTRIRASTRTDDVDGTLLCMRLRWRRDRLLRGSISVAGGLAASSTRSAMESLAATALRDIAALAFLACVGRPVSSDLLCGRETYRSISPRRVRASPGAMVVHYGREAWDCFGDRGGT